MNEEEYEAYMRQMDDDIIFNTFLTENEQEAKPIKIGKIIIPGDRETFNQMWLEKAFDNIDPSQLLKINTLSLLRKSLHMGRYNWDEYFFKKRDDLLHTSADKIWKDSDYYMEISMNIFDILTLTSKSQLKIMGLIKPQHLTSKKYYISFGDKDDNKIIQKYLSGPPEDLMFPHSINESKSQADQISIIYSHPQLIKVLREITLRYQYLCNKTNEERISIYMKEITELYMKIKFIQSLMYFGVSHTIRHFKEMKHNYLNVDPETNDITQEPNEFQEVSYKEALYKFYIHCSSPEKMSLVVINKAHFLGNIVVQHEDITRIITSYLLPLSSCIKQDKLKTVCCQIILSYLRPKCVTDRYITSKMLSIF
jgi:hypothetical protein